MNKKKYINFWIILISFFILSLSFVYFLAFRRENLEKSFAYNQGLLLLLWYLNITFIVVLFFIITRQLVKLIMERKEKALGFRLRTKLIISLMALVLIPIIFLFIFALDLIVQSNQIPPDIPEVFNEIEEIVRDWDKKELEKLYLDLRQIKSHFEKIGENNWYKEGTKFCTKNDLSFFQTFREKKFLFSINCKQVIKNPSLSYEFLKEVEEKGRSFFWKEERGNWLLVTGLYFLKEGISYQIILGKVYPEMIGKAREKFLVKSQNLKEFSYQKKSLDAIRILIFLLLTLSIAFAGLWMGTYLTRYFTTPLSQILEGTREVAKGNLDIKLSPSTMEDWDLLFIHFNYMVQELKNYRTLLAKEREYLMTLLENLELGILNVGFDGSIITINKKGKEFLGIGDLKENFFNKIKGDFPSLYNWLEESLKTKKPLSNIFEIKSKGLTLSISFFPFYENSFLLILEDVTEFIRAQRMGTWKEVAQKIAHEIKNPLTPIQLMAEHLKKKAEGNLEKEEILSSLNTILDEVQHLQSMVDSFSQFARMPMPSPKRFNLKDLFYQLKDLYGNLHKDLSLEIIINEDLPEIWADKELLRRALVNLIDNSIEACKFKGKITLSAEIKGEEVFIFVIDEGPGIPENIKEKIFQPYISTKGRGSGMGLSIVDRIVKDHGGKIKFEDNSPKGTKSIISLPNP